MIVRKETATCEHCGEEVELIRGNWRVVPEGWMVVVQLSSPNVNPFNPYEKTLCSDACLAEWSMDKVLSKEGGED